LHFIAAVDREEVMNQSLPRIVLKPGRDRSIRHGHPWIFSGAVASVTGSPGPGDIVLAVSHDGAPLALGFFNDRSDIRFRMLSGRVDTPVDASFWAHRIRSAAALRQQIVPPGTTAWRLINAEGDGMPGLIVDRYGEDLVMSIATAGIEKYRATILDQLQRICHPARIYERSEGRARQREGLEDRIGPAIVGLPAASLVITENHLRFEVDIIAGQKTGFFLDQRDNRERMGDLSRGAEVLNCFSYTGGFSVYCARGGASRVVSVETSASANDMARRNLTLNGFSPEAHPVIQADVFQYLRKTDDLFDLIILDPPSFAKTKGDVVRASRGYKDINLQAIRRLREGGLLATFSCSNYVDEVLFEKIVLGAARDAAREVQTIARLGAAGDHPILLAHPEGRYLKGLLLRITS
jgi:23S rRNA (cytosine1962-C5)-methyltransferase